MKYLKWSPDQTYLCPACQSEKFWPIHVCREPNAKGVRIWGCRKCRHLVCLEDPGLENYSFRHEDTLYYDLPDVEGF